ncbi:uncharacterized protein LOC123884332 isoform X1 [Trifolium pratense]|uniref:uncharacterized protein LOC123884332 isoform X1 n=1 Tax=Trifolium pratense TaxID=57577 RepID=UPI001E696542|nr:uncharacterized protein LOC123884332 isoform X1 [Trifolium pratense]
MDVDREIIIGEYPLPPPRVDSSPVGYFLWMRDRLSCIVLVKGISRISRTYQIYALDLDLGKWTLYHEMRPFDYGDTCGHVLGLMFRFWINDQIFFIALTRPPEIRKSYSGVTKSILFCYNVKTGQLTKTDDIAVGSFQVVWMQKVKIVQPQKFVPVVYVRKVQFVQGYHLVLTHLLNKITEDECRDRIVRAINFALSASRTKRVLALQGNAIVVQRYIIRSRA